MAFPVKVFNKKGKLKKIIGTKELAIRSDEIFRNEIKTSHRGNKKMSTYNCKDCDSEFQGTSQYKYCDPCRSTKMHNNRSVPNIYDIIP